MIGIVTINDNNNYGNRLQNYAVYTILSRYDQTYNIVRPEGIDKAVYPKNPLVFIRKVIRYVIRKFRPVKTVKSDIDRGRFWEERVKNFQNFNSNIKNGETLTSTFDYSLLNKYDFFVAGSDQVWNPKFYPNMYINMLGFAPPSKRVALAPSIACDSLTREQEDEFKKYLKGFKFLSCREFQGSKIISKLANKECVTLIDPTLVLGKADWDMVAKKPVFHDDSQKYILLYFLGGLSESYKKMINDLCDTTGLKIINVYDKHNEYYSCGPAEFIYLIAHSELTLTDSFHACVFSYIYDKPFRIFEREGTDGSMNSRLTTFIKKLKIDNAVYMNEEKNVSSMFHCQYDKQVLYEEQKRFEEYLEMVLEG